MTRVHYQFSAIVDTNAVLVDVAGDPDLLDRASDAMHARLAITRESRAGDIQLYRVDHGPESASNLVTTFTEMLEDCEHEDPWVGLLATAEKLDIETASGAPFEAHQCIAVWDNGGGDDNAWSATVHLPATVEAETWLNDWLAAVGASGLVHLVDARAPLNPDDLPDEKAMPALILAELALFDILDGPLVEAMESWKTEVVLSELPATAPSRSPMRL